ncbi:MAG: family efflux transporter subunit [Candidatus Peribacteria bacterium]|nr:family efflux transporter subunit [Candidatus Peribacteria bacterium]
MSIASYPSRFFYTLWRNKWKTLIALLVIVPVASAVYKLSQPKQPEYVTADATRGDLTQIVEAVGTIVSDRNLELQFKTPGIVSQVYVREGQKVHAGQKLAALRAGSLGAGIASAAASVREMQVQLQALKEGTRPEELAVSEATVANKRASLGTAKTALKTALVSLKSSQDNLQALKDEAGINLQGQVSTAVNVINEKISRSEQALQTIDDVFANNDVQDAIIKSSPGNYNDLQKQKNAVRQTLTLLRAKTLPADYQGALQLLSLVRTAIGQAASVTDAAYNTVSGLPETNYLTASKREAYKAQLATEKNAIIAALSSLDASVSALQNASATYNTRISAEEASIVASQGAADKAQSDIQIYETSLMIDEAQLNLKRAGARPTDLAAAEARVRQMQAGLARASADYGDTVIVAPVDGTVTKVDVKTGESTPVGPAITLLGKAPLRVEMLASEVDVPKIKLSQSGSIELDAFKDVHYTLHVSEIADAPTDVSGVSKYKVKLDFVYPHTEIKIGMSGNADITTGSSKNIVMVPLRAVLQDSSGQKIVRVLGKDGTIEDRFVKTGMEGQGGNIEVSDVKEGEKVIVLVKK